MQETTTPTSQTFKTFLDNIAAIKKDYHWHYEQVGKLNDLTQDYLHSLELDSLDYKSRAKLATQLAKCRQKRRESKDMVEILSPAVDFLESDKGELFIRQLQEVLGKVRKEETRHQNRIYIPKVLEKET